MNFIVLLATVLVVIFLGFLGGYIVVIRLSHQERNEEPQDASDSPERESRVEIDWAKVAITVYLVLLASGTVWALIYLSSGTHH